MINKLHSIVSLKESIKKQKKLGSIIGFTNGCFDLLHQGHVSLIKNAREMCDYLIVGLNSDNSVKLLKGANRPIDNEKIRIKNLANVKEVDAIIVFPNATPLELIAELNPNILIKGSDYKSKLVVGANIIAKNGGRVEYVPILKGFSTTKIINNKLIN